MTLAPSHRQIAGMIVRAALCPSQAAGPFRVFIQMLLSYSRRTLRFSRADGEPGPDLVSLEQAVFAAQSGQADLADATLEWLVRDAARSSARRALYAAADALSDAGIFPITQETAPPTKETAPILQTVR